MFRSKNHFAACFSALQWFVNILSLIFNAGKFGSQNAMRLETYLILCVLGEGSGGVCVCGGGGEYLFHLSLMRVKPLQ